MANRSRRAGLVALATATLIAVAGQCPSTAQAQPEGLKTRNVTDGSTSFVQVTNPGGPRLSYSPDSGMKLITRRTSAATLAFKDMNANGSLETWED